MLSRVSLLPTAFPGLFAHTIASGVLTLADRYGLMAALLQDSLSDEDLSAIDRLLYAIRQGKVRITDEISAVL